jgi:hypothetical protein|tara:strand:+ start:63 stop:401 length:339 start_codon:yes stop_codon:yes gene_type:complete
MEIINTNDFCKLITSNRYASGDIIHTLKGEMYNKPSRTTIEIGKDLHVDDPYGIFINHAFDPTCVIIKDTVVAAKDMEIGEEITFNYNVSETKMATPFVDTMTGHPVCGHSN